MNSGCPASRLCGEGRVLFFVQPPFWKKSFVIAEEFTVVRTPRHAVTSPGLREL